jgi:hypothetical protein
VVARLAGLAPAALVERLAAEQCTGACEDDVALLAVRVGASGAGQGHEVAAEVARTGTLTP